MGFSLFEDTGKCIATLDTKLMHWLLYFTLVMELELLGMGR